MEVSRLTAGWFRILVGDTIDYTELIGWRKTGQPKQVNPSFTELKTVRCIIHGPQLEDIYTITEKSKLLVDYKTVAFTSGLLEEKVKIGTGPELVTASMKTPSPSLHSSSSYDAIAEKTRWSSDDLVEIDVMITKSLKR